MQEIKQNIIEIQTKLAFQEETIEQLNDVIINQQKAIDKLQRQLNQLDKKIDEENINYDFRSVKILGDTEYDFQIGLVGKFTKEAAIAMFEAVQ